MSQVQVIGPSATAVLKLLSPPRAAPYRELFKPEGNEELLGVYMWAQAVSASLHPFLGLAEVVLRNAIHQSLSAQCSKGQSESFPWYDRAETGSLPLHGKSKEKVEEILSEGIPPIRKAVQPAPDAVIASLSFGFWPNVMEGLSGVYAPRAFTNVFPAHPNSKPQHWSRLSNRETVVLRLKRLQALRNRISHFEPVWKPHWLGVPSTNWSHSVKGLRDFHSDMVELLSWCSSDAVSAYKASFAWNWFNMLCTTDAVKAFMGGEGLDSALLRPFSSPIKTPIAIEAPSCK